MVGRALLPSGHRIPFNPVNSSLPGYAFALDENYSIEIQLIQTIDGSSTNLANDNVKSISRVYADFTPNTGDGPAVYLPVVVENNVFQLTFPSTPVLG